MAIKVSVFIPTYNSAAFIADTLDSILFQTYKDIEVLCVDDGSADNTVELIQQYASKDNRVRLFQKENEGSVPFSWNFVFPYIKGDFTIYLSHDDIFAPNMIEKLVQNASADDDIDCVIPSLVFFERDIDHPEPRYAEQNKKGELGNHPTVTGEQAFAEMLDYSIPGFALWRTSLIKELGMPTTSFNSDECMQRLWAKKCRKVAFSDARFGYRQSSNSIVKGMKPYHLFSLDTNLRLFKEMKSCDAVPVEKKRKQQYQYYEALFYLTRQYRKMKKQISSEQCQQLESLIAESYKAYSNNLKVPLNAKGLAMRVTTIHRTLFDIFVTL